MRVLYLGMLGEFSIPPLAALLEAGIDVCGVVVPAARQAGTSGAPIAKVALEQPPSQLPVVNPFLERSIVHLAWERDIAVFEVSHPGRAETLAALSALRPDVAGVACFPQRLPASLLTLPPHGFLNLHPSLLPAYRGPAPLFWTFRSGESVTGVTIHFMDEGLDTGDIALQAPLDLPDGISGAEADRGCAALGGRLMVEAVQALEHGALPRRKQPAGGSYYPSPSADDFKISTTWPARRAFNFMRGTAEWGQPYSVEVDGESLILKLAVSYSANETLGRDAPIVQLGSEAWIQFTPGVLKAWIG